MSTLMTEGPRRSHDDSYSTCHSSDNGGIGHAQLNVGIMATMVSYPFVRGKGGWSTIPLS
jgi:hypothetical protein